jgi:DNA repair exonuclease SbcCD ATPase subunit
MFKFIKFSNNKNFQIINNLWCQNSIIKKKFYSNIKNNRCDYNKLRMINLNNISNSIQFRMINYDNLKKIVKKDTDVKNIEKDIDLNIEKNEHNNQTNILKNNYDNIEIEENNIEKDIDIYNKINDKNMKIISNQTNEINELKNKIKLLTDQTNYKMVEINELKNKIKLITEESNCILILVFFYIFFIGIK